MGKEGVRPPRGEKNSEKVVGSVDLQVVNEDELLGLGNREREPTRCDVQGIEAR